MTVCPIAPKHSSGWMRLIPVHLKKAKRAEGGNDISSLELDSHKHKHWLQIMIKKAFRDLCMAYGHTIKNEEENFYELSGLKPDCRIPSFLSLWRSLSLTLLDRDRCNDVKTQVFVSLSSAFSPAVFFLRDIVEHTSNKLKCPWQMKADLETYRKTGQV